MDNIGDLVFYWLTDETNLTILLFSLAVLLSISSLLLFFISGGQSPTRLELGLLVAAMGVLFYLSLRNSGF
ncbi:hypothetical protein ACFFQF_01655 [Haladaptatus pallidirubidus]|uniref:Uncharacterized protein n=1 Tax=Haladaptatus pallidirubidus TaxID=1008152 RepID=A0AAV3UB30_9EURY|nr:hypothetical protein [Haladaptatus pallidirubidus]